VGHPDPDDQVQVTLEFDGEELDISRCHRMVALAPLTIAVGDAPLKTQFGSRAHSESSAAGPKPWPHIGSTGVIVVKERGPAGRLLGHIKVRLTRSLEVCGTRIALLEVGESRNYCVSPVRDAAIRSYEAWKAARDRNPRNIGMTPSDMFAMWILHDAPRPVVAVSYGSEEKGNLFPMDLVGPVTDGCYVLGLHSSSPALPIFRDAGRIAVSEMPVQAKDAVYALGKNHREDFREVRKLPLPVARSPLFGIPVPEQALCVRELVVEQVENLGSHHLLATSVKSLENKSGGPRMTHIHRLYQQYLMRQGRAL
jgi:flavin reductase (DIM6/NTAB) family NADH-FMN oxidoreductase RutF